MAAASSDRICGCHVVTGAGIITSLQFILLLICMASTGLILDKYFTLTDITNTAATIVSGNKTTRVQPTLWALAWVQLGMAWYVAYAAFWLFSLLILVLSFKYYRPVFVVPNFTALVVGLFMHLFIFAVLLARIVDVSKKYQVDGYQDVLIVYVIGLFLFTFIMNIFFIVFIARYHGYLRIRYGHQVPKFVQSRGPRTAYPEEMVY